MKVEKRGRRGFKPGPAFPKETTKDQARELQSPAEVARRLGMSRSNVYHLATVGALPSIKFGKAVRFDPADVDRFIREHRRGKGKAA